MLFLGKNTHVPPYVQALRLLGAQASQPPVFGAETSPEFARIPSNFEVSK